MNRIAHTIFAATLALAASTAAAQGRGGALMDSNKDGKVSAEEYAAHAKAMFEQMDSNHDGKVTATEMTAAHRGAGGARARRSGMLAVDRLKAFDADGDGVLTADEHAKGAADMFAAMDTNKDGFLTTAEFTPGHARGLKKPAG